MFSVHAEARVYLAFNHKFKHNFSKWQPSEQERKGINGH